VSRRAVFGSSVALGLACLGAGAMAQPLELQIRNDVATHPLRCVLVLAHWYSEELPPVAPGASTRLSLESNLADGSIVRRNEAARAMAVEGLYCLSGPPGGAERAAVAIDVLRDVTGVVPVYCGDHPRLACSVFLPPH
jgi:hypothetical protein